MGKRGAKSKFTDVYCPNQDCKFSSISWKGNIVGNGTYQIKNKKVRRYICHECGRVFNDRTDTFWQCTESSVKLTLYLLFFFFDYCSITIYLFPVIHSSFLSISIETVSLNTDS